MSPVPPDYQPANFLGLDPQQADPDQARYVILPIPYDATASFLSGTRHGPQAIIDASQQVEWYDEELFAGSSFLGTDIAEPYFWVAQSLAEGRDVLVSTLDDFPPDAEAERKTCEALAIRSVLWVPFWTREQVTGYVAYNSIGRETVWTKQIVRRLRLAGEIIGAALDRRRQAGEVEARLERSEEPCGKAGVRHR